MTRFTTGLVTGLLCITTCVVPFDVVCAQQRYALDTADGLRLYNVTARSVTHRGRKGIRVAADSARARAAGAGAAELELLAIVEGVTFSSGVIEAEIAGAPAAGANEGARGFVGIAFRLRPDLQTYDAFYLRPTNGRAEDQERRNHAAQYISEPDWPWFRLRRETPSRYESYVDLVPDEWTKIRIEVRGERALLYVHDQPQPTLIVNDAKSGAGASGAVALWLGPGTVAHFRNLTVRTDPERR